MRLEANQVNFFSREWTRVALKTQSGRVTSYSPGHTPTGKYINEINALEHTGDWNTQRNLITKAVGGF